MVVENRSKEQKYCLQFLTFVNRSMKNSKSGQTIVEYAIVAGMLVLCITIFAVFLYTFRENSSRILDLAASEYP